MRSLWQIKTASRRIRRRFRPGAIILMYHRIADQPSDRFCVAPDIFAKHLDYIRQTCQPLRLLDAVEAVQQNSLPRRTVVVTFDDNYVEILHEACPRLAATKIPATAFVIAGDIDRPPLSWKERLDYVLIQATRLPARLQLSIHNQEYDWPTEEMKQRQQVYTAICQILQSLESTEQTKVINGLTIWAGLKGGKARSAYSAMTSAEIIQLAQDGLVELGAHTVTHPILSTLSPAEQQAEIAGSRERLEALIGKPVLTFAYPYGQDQDFTSETVESVRAAGFRAACTTIPGAVERGDDLFRLRRHYVGNWDLETFKKNLEWLLIA